MNEKSTWEESVFYEKTNNNIFYHIFDELFEQDKSQSKTMSAIICVMDRIENLNKSLEFCLKHPHVYQTSRPRQNPKRMV